MNKEAIYATRPWATFGEGPASAGADMKAQGFNEGRGKPFTAEDVRFTTSKDGRTLYAIMLGWPGTTATIKSLGAKAGLLDRPISQVELLGSKDPVSWKQTDDGLELASLPGAPATDANAAAAFMITLR